MGKDSIKDLIFKMHSLEREILPFLKNSDFNDIKQKTNLNEEQVKLGLEYLSDKNIVEISFNKKEVFRLSSNGLKYKNSDLPENIFLKETSEGKKNEDEFSISKMEIFGILSILKRNNLVNVKNDNSKLSFEIIDKNLIEKFLKSNENFLKKFDDNIYLESLNEEDKKIFFELNKRKFYEKKNINEISFKLTNFGENVLKEFNSKYLDFKFIDNLTSQMLKDKSYENKTFRHYDVNIDTGFSNNIGRRHPSIEANNIFRDIFLEMGFEEMEGPIVENEFWCFDNLWIPQDHPARDDQDTFFLEGVSKIDEELAQKVKELHENGIKNGHTDKGAFSFDITKRRILRTHSTATTFRKLFELSKKFKNGEDINGKYFYIAHNFRNEAVDATHLAEFFQAEGILIGDNLSLCELMGFMREFYKKFGIEKIKFKPTFNPYTEPSMEIHYFDEKLNKWYSIGNSGIFRAECLKQYGLENKTIYGWGLGTARVAMLLAQKNSLKEITGHTCDINWLKTRKHMTRKIIR